MSGIDLVGDIEERKHLRKMEHIHCRLRKEYLLCNDQPVRYDDRIILLTTTMASIYQKNCIDAYSVCVLVIFAIG